MSERTHIPSVWLLAGWLSAMGLMPGLAQEGGEEAPAPPKYRQAALIRFEGEISPLSEQSFYRRLSAARKYSPDLLVVEIDSPGGWVDASLRLADTLRQIGWARTVAFIPDEAISGAAVMALGCDDILIAPHGHLGDAGEIFMDEEGAFRYVEEKARSYLASRLRVLAKAKGRSPALAEAMCDMNMVVYQVRHKESGAEAYMSDHELASAADAPQWEKLRPVFASREKHFLTMDGEEAVSVKFAQAIASTPEEVWRHYGYTGEAVVLDHTALDTAVVILNTPLVTGLLIVVGLIGIYIEFSMPGTFLGGMVAGLCLALFFWSRYLGGTSGWLELILFLAGLVFIGMELFVIPGFGVAGIVGILMLVASLIMASQSFAVPHTSRELNTTLTQVGIVTTSLLVFLACAFVISRYLGAIPVARGLILELPSPAAGAQLAGAASSEIREKSMQPAAAGMALGDEGVADSPLRPAGKARFGERYLDVVSDGSFVDRGQAVRIIEVSGNRIVVRAVG